MSNEYKMTNAELERIKRALATARAEAVAKPFAAVFGGKQ